MSNVVQAESDREGIFLVSCGEEFVFCTAMSEETSPAAPLLDSAEAVPVFDLQEGEREYSTKFELVEEEESITSKTSLISGNT